MSISTEQRRQVRERAGYACEFCGVTETDVGSELTIDHFWPKTLGGADDLKNLVYCCVACNQFKADYWPATSDAPSLWNPRAEPAKAHLLPLADGTVHALTPTGDFTIRRLRLNRPPLVAGRIRQQSHTGLARLLQRYQEGLRLLEASQQHLVALLEEHRALLEEQRALLKLLTAFNEGQKK